MAELRVTSTGTIKLFESDDTSSVTIASPASLGGDRTITLPDANVDLTEVNTMPIANLDIDGGTDIGANIADSDLLIIDDGAGGTNRKTAASRIKTYVGAGAGAFDIANLDIDGGTDIGAAITDSDLFIIDDGAGGTNRKTAASRIKTYIGTGGLTPLAQLASSSDVATIALDGFMDASSYAYYKVFAAVKSAGNGNVLECRFRDGGSALNANNYYYANHGYTADIGETTVGASPQNSASLFSDGSTHTAIFEFTIFPDDGISNQSLSRCFWTSSDSKYNSNTRKARTTRGAFHFLNDTVPDGFHIHNDTSNFEDYAMYAYGVKKYS